jgi:beta-lactamase class A
MRVGSMKVLKWFLVVFLISTIILNQSAKAAELSANQKFARDLSADIYQYLKKSGGTVALQYHDLTTGEAFQIKGKTVGLAASTIKLPPMI